MSRAKTILRQTALLETLLEENFNAIGADLEEKARSVALELPKGIQEKLAFLSKLQRSARAGEEISKADAKQAGYWINASRPYLDFGAPRKSGWAVVVRIAVLIFLALATLFLSFLGSRF